MSGPKQWIVTPDLFISENVNPDIILCAICGQLMTNPTMLLDMKYSVDFKTNICETICEHAFCKACINQVLDKRCPLCRTRYFYTAVNITLNKLIQTQKMRCVNKECDSKFYVKDVQSHQLVCEYEQEKCVHCSKTVIRGQLTEHKTICDHRPTQCEKCAATFTFNYIQEHLEKYCNMIEIACTFAGCGKRFLRKDQYIHYSVCEYNEFPCVFGCGVNIIKKDMMNHTFICPNRTVKCSYCNANIKENLLPVHYNTCPDILVECECKVKVLRKNLLVHLTKCDFTKIPCQYFDLGCCKFIPRREMLKHLMENNTDHDVADINRIKNLTKPDNLMDFLDDNGKWIIITMKSIDGICFIGERKVYPNKIVNIAINWSEMGYRLRCFGTRTIMKKSEIEFYNLFKCTWEKATVTQTSGNWDIEVLTSTTKEWINLLKENKRVANLGTNIKPE